MKPLTDIQRKVYDFLVTHKSEHGIPPTRAEISGHFGWASVNAAQCVLKAIEKKGWISILEDRSRGVVVHKPSRIGHAKRDMEPVAAIANTMEG